ncbi:MAG TPA: PIG-L family deacetylase [Acidimicrobiales bacterium]|nr:PIG-L family deacetylase [Acidimicrobiales bacterium]
MTGVDGVDGDGGGFLPPGPGTLLVLSPHFDDAALSCGATVARAAEDGWRVVVVVVFAGTPPPASLTPAARDYHELCELGDDAIAVRAGEDRAAMAVLSAEPHHLDQLEALYRLRPDGTPAYPHWTDLNDPPAGPEPELVAAITDAVAAAVATHRPDLVLHPLAVGGHVDHLAVRAAARAVAAAGVRWLAYEDVPYATFPWFAGWQEAVAAEWQPTDHEVGERLWTRKLDAVECYPSQLVAMFGKPSAWREYLTAYARGLTDSGQPVERFWRPHAEAQRH